MSNRATYQKLPNLHLGSSKRPALNAVQRQRLLEARLMINNALIANGDSYANVNLTNAYRIIRSIMSERISN